MVFKITSYYSHGYYGFTVVLLHSKKCWVVLTQLWVKYGLTQPLG